jgi:hypothetical protein
MQGKTLLVPIVRLEIQADRLVQAGRQVSNYKQTNRLVQAGRQVSTCRQTGNLVDRKWGRYRETGRLKKADRQAAQLGLSRDDGSILAIAKHTTSHL